MNNASEMPTTDPRELRVILALLEEGFSRDEICKRLGIGKTTYYRRLAEIRESREQAEKSREYD